MCLIVFPRNLWSSTFSTAMEAPQFMWEPKALSSPTNSNSDHYGTVCQIWLYASLFFRDTCGPPHSVQLWRRLIMCGSPKRSLAQQIQTPTTMELSAKSGDVPHCSSKKPVAFHNPAKVTPHHNVLLEPEAFFRPSNEPFIYRLMFQSLVFKYGGLLKYSTVIIGCFHFLYC